MPLITQFRPLLVSPPVVAAGASFTTVFTSALNDTTDSGWAGINYVGTLNATHLSSAVGQTCRLSLLFSALGNGTTVGVYFGQQGAGDVYDFNTTPAHVLFSGANITGDGSTLAYVSDPFTLPEAWDNTKNYNAAYDFSAGTVTLPCKTMIANTVHSRYKTGVGDAATVDKTGYLVNSEVLHELISKIEIAS